MSSHLPLSATMNKNCCRYYHPDSTPLSLSLTFYSSPLHSLSHSLTSSPPLLLLLPCSLTPSLSLLSVFRHFPQQHYDPVGPLVSASALAVGGQHPPVTGGVPAGARPPLQRPALPTGHGGGGVDAHAPPVRLGEDQVC